MSYRDASAKKTAALVLLIAVGTVGIAEIGNAQTIIVPTLTVSEMYDSNVFFTPKSLLPPGTKPEDFVTTIVPQITTGYSGSQISGNLSLGALITRYINNPDLDYTGVNAAGNLNATTWAKRFSQRLTTLNLRALYQFTPSMSQFGGVGGQYGAGFGSPYGASGLGTALNSGLVTNRVSVNNVNAGASAGYQLTRTTTMTGTFNYTGIFFGNQNGVENQLFNTNAYTGMVTLSSIITRRDTVGTTATLSHYQQSQSNGSGSGSFTTPMGTINWSRLWTPQLTTNISAGGQVILPIESTVAGQSTKTQVAPTGTIGITYRSFSETLRAAGTELGGTDVGPSTYTTAVGSLAGSGFGPFYGMPGMQGSLSPGGILTPGQIFATLTYNYSYYPSYAYGAGATRTNVVAAVLNGGITSKLSGLIGMNFAHGTSAASNSNFSYETVGATAGVRYLIGPILASLTGNWLYFSNSTADPTGGSSDTAFSKKQVLLALSYAFTGGQSFFKMDRFGFVGPREFLGGSSAPSEGGGGGEVAPSSGAPAN